MEQLFSTTPLQVIQLINKIELGELGLPELQRPFIWKDAKVRDLFDSMMKGYPIGYLMIWDCPELDKKKQIGVEEHNYPTPKEVIIDGQQRLTCLYAVMKGKKVKNDKYEDREIIISFNPIKCIFEVGDQATKRDKEWIYNISNAYTTNSFQFISDYINALKAARINKGLNLTNEEIKVISDNITALYNLQSFILPVFNIKSSADEESVSNIFVRVNSGGITLKQNDFVLTLVSLYWQEGRTLIEQFSKESRVPSLNTTSYNSITEVEPQDIVRVVIAYGFDRARLKYGYKLLRGADFDKKGAIDVTLRNQRFDVLKEKLNDVLNVHTWHEFLKCIMNAGYHSKDMISSDTAIFYAYALYLIAKHRFKASYNENLMLISKWYFYISLISLYSGSFESTMETHLNTIKELTNFDEFKMYLEKLMSEKLTNDYFTITLPGSDGLAVSGKGNAAWNAYCASLNILDTHLLFSKGNLLVSKLYEVGVDGNRRSLEKHHLFPKAYLKSLGYNDVMINQMANYAYIDWKDNMEILDENPANYYPLVCNGKKLEEILKMEEENALPHGWENMTYEQFLTERRKLMALKIKQAYEKLNTK